MPRIKNNLCQISILFFITVPFFSYAMEDHEDQDEYRRQALETNAHKRLYAKMDGIIARDYNGIETLTEAEQYLLLTRLNERIHLQDLPPLKPEKKLFFQKLMLFASPQIIQRIFPPSRLQSIPPGVPPRVPLHLDDQDTQSDLSDCSDIETIVLEALDSPESEDSVVPEIETDTVPPLQAPPTLVAVASTSEVLRAPRPTTPLQLTPEDVAKLAQFAGEQ